MIWGAVTEIKPKELVISLPQGLRGTASLKQVGVLGRHGRVDVFILHACVEGEVSRVGACERTKQCHPVLREQAGMFCKVLQICMLALFAIKGTHAIISRCGVH